MLEGEGAIEIPGYRGLTVVGQGAGSVLLRAEHVRADRLVAVKVLAVTDGDPDDPVALPAHPSIHPVLDVGTTPDGRRFVVTEYCRDGSYLDELSRRGPLRIDDAVEIGTQVAEALVLVHDAGVVHGGVKPSNILFAEAGPALTDFAFARAAPGRDPFTMDPMTLHHTAPEALSGAPVGPATDLYGLAATLWHLLAGWPPFGAPDAELRSPADVADLIRTQQAPPVPRRDVPLWLQRELVRAMAKEPGGRHENATQFVEALRERLGGMTARSGNRFAEPAAARPATATTAAPEEDQPEFPPIPVAAPIPVAPATPAAPHRPADGGEPARRRDDRLPDPAFDGAAAWDERPAQRRTWPLVVGAVVAMVAMALVVSGVFDGSTDQGAAPTASVTADASVQAAGPGSSATAANPAASPAPSGTASVTADASVPATGPPPSGTPSAQRGAPGDVRLADGGATITITWTDRAGGAAQFAVLGGPRGAEATVRRLLRPGSTKLVLDGLDPRQDYCFQVVAILGTEDYARSEQVCTNRS
ncbi:protein kinase [Dactylosporangium sp. NPDC005572]|uniref:protein kinase domain-containing protein n=1 Tax=Dactylosporangium sp. NPDC005572 TaxID=3156889 RepID=UPI0033AFD336